MIHIGILTLSGFTRSGLLRSVIGLHSSNIGREVPVREIPAQFLTFLNQFLKVGGNYPATYFRTLGWVFFFKEAWWSSLMMYVLEVFEVDFKRLGLYEVVRATCFKIIISIPTFYAILNMYCLASSMFFTPIGELGMALHKI